MPETSDYDVSPKLEVRGGGGSAPLLREEEDAQARLSDFDFLPPELDEEPSPRLTANDRMAKRSGSSCRGG